MMFLIRFPLALPVLAVLLSAPLSQAAPEPHPVPGQPWWQERCNVYQLKTDDGLVLSNVNDSGKNLPKLVKPGTIKEEDTWFIKYFRETTPKGRTGGLCDQGSEDMTLASYSTRGRLLAAWNNGDVRVQVDSSIPEGLDYTQYLNSLNLCMGPAKNGVKGMVSFKNMFEDFYLMMAGSPSDGYLTVVNNPSSRMNELISFRWEAVPGFPDCAPSKAPTMYPTPSPTPLPTGNPTPAPVIPPPAPCGLVRFQSHDRSAYIRHAGFQGFVDPLGDSDPLVQDSWFYIRPCHHDKKNCGDSRCVSLESYNYKNYWLRHENRDINLNPFEDRDVFHLDASFCIRTSTNGQAGGISFESVNYPGEFITTWNHGNRLRIQAVGGSTDEKNAASFHKHHLDCPKCVSFHTVNVGSKGTHLSLRHENGDFYAKPLYDDDTKFWVVPCHHGNDETCGGDQCISLESINNRRQYVRHRDGEIHLDGFADNDRYKKDASWCVRRHNRPGNYPILGNAEYISLGAWEFQDKHANLESAWIWTHDTVKNPNSNWLSDLIANTDKKTNIRIDQDREGVYLRDRYESAEGRKSDARWSQWWIMKVRNDCGDNRQRRLTSMEAHDTTNKALRGSEQHPLADEWSNYPPPSDPRMSMMLDSIGTPGALEFDEENGDNGFGNLTAVAMEEYAY